MEAMISVPIRIDALHLLSRCPGRATVFHHGYSELLSYSEFACNRSRFECVSVKVGYALTDVDVHEGAFAVIPGSHKGNYASPGNTWRIPMRTTPWCRPVPAGRVTRSSSPRT